MKEGVDEETSVCDVWSDLGLCTHGAHSLLSVCVHWVYTVICVWIIIMCTPIPCTQGAMIVKHQQILYI